VTRIPILLPLLLAAGCLEAEDDVVDFAEDFETCLECHWNITGDVEIVTTVHPGEHAARLGGDAVLHHDIVIERAYESDNGYPDNFSDGNWIEFSTDCAGTPLLAIEGTASELRVRVRLEAPWDETFMRRRLMFPPLPGYIDDGETVVFRHLVIETGAPCRLDNLRLMVSGGTLGY
jgi:hypothetical protein